MKNLILIILFTIGFCFSSSAKTVLVYTSDDGITRAIIIQRDIDCDTFEPAIGITIDDCFNFLESDATTIIDAIGSSDNSLHNNNYTKGVVETIIYQGQRVQAIRIETGELVGILRA